MQHRYPGHKNRKSVRGMARLKRPGCTKCSNSAVPGTRLCLRHTPKNSTIPAPYPQVLRRTGEPSVYADPRWARLRDERLPAFCDRCKRSDKPTANKIMILDHILPVAYFAQLAFEESNTQVLCLTCHNFKSGKERVGLAYDYRRQLIYSFKIKKDLEAWAA